MSNSRHLKELTLTALNGYVMAGLGVMAALLALWGFWVEMPVMVALGVLTAAFMFSGIFVLAPNQAAALVLFGAYSGTVRRSGLHWALPFYKKETISLRLRNLNSEKMKVNDFGGNPIEISAVVVWRVRDTAQALFAVDRVERYVEMQAEAAVRQIAALHPYDNHEEKSGVLSLRENVNEVNESLKEQLELRFEQAGVEVVDARVNHLAYAPEIAQVMLRRQAAEAVIGARQKLVEGAVGMVELALRKLSEGKVVELDEERKASMVSNLLVVLCSEVEAQPVINAGSLYS